MDTRFKHFFYFQGNLNCKLSWFNFNRTYKQKLDLSLLSIWSSVRPTSINNSCGAQGLGDGYKYYKPNNAFCKVSYS